MLVLLLGSQSLRRCGGGGGGSGGGGGGGGGGFRATRKGVLKKFKKSGVTNDHSRSHNPCHNPCTRPQPACIPTPLRCRAPYTELQTI